MIDWQTPVAVAVGLLAAAHLLKRWWPTWKGLLHSSSASHTGAEARTACSNNTSTSCGSGGCGSCTSSSTAAPKDHRIQVLHKPRA